MTGARGEEDRFQRPCHQCRRHLVTHTAGSSTTPHDVSMPLSPHSIPDNSGCTCGTATTTLPRAASLGRWGWWGPNPTSCRESSTWTVWPAVGEGLPYALVLVLALALLFSGSPGACCCCLYSTLGFILRYSGQKGGEGLPLSHDNRCPRSSLCVVMSPPLPSLFIIPCTYCVYYMSLVLFYFPVSPKCPRLSPPGKCLHGAGRYEGTALLSVSVDKWLAERGACLSLAGKPEGTPEGTTQMLHQQYPFF